MNPPKISRTTLQELVREVLTNKGFTPPEVVNVSDVVDPLAAVSDPINPTFTPQNKIELTVAIDDMLKGVENDNVPELYAGVKDLIGKQEEDKEKKMSSDLKKKTTEKDVKAVEESIRVQIRRLLSERFIMEKAQELKPDEEEEDPEDAELTRQLLSKKWSWETEEEEAAKSGEKPWDPDRDADDDDDEAAKKDDDLEDDHDGMKFKDIDVALDTGGVHNARQEFNRALMKARWMAAQPVQKRQELLNQVKDDYIDTLSSSGELSPADVQLLRDHPNMVTNLDGFREFLHSYVKQYARSEIEDMKNVKIDGDEVERVKLKPDAHSGAEPAPGRKVYGRRGNAPVHTRFKGRIFTPSGGSSEFQPGGTASMELGADGKLKVSDPTSGKTQYWESKSHKKGKK